MPTKNEETDGPSEVVDSAARVPESGLEGGGNDDEPANGLGERLLQWFHQRRLSAEERNECLAALAIRSDGPWWHRFFIVMFVSVVIATVGLLLDSVAVVIGAMLIAPLMTPVLAFSASLAMGWPRQALRQFAGLVAATIGAVAIAWLIGAVVPRDDLTNEVLSRTSPDLRDLVVALAAGFGGAYVTVRRTMAGSLPGVAVAVALVPPLGAVGLALSADQQELAAGAALLYLANLAAIILSGLAVFVSTGFVPASRLSFSWGRVAIGAVLVAVSVGLIAVPLARESVEAVSSAQRLEQVNQRINAWLSDSPDRLADLSVDESVVTVAVIGPVEPPPAAQLRQALENIIGDDLNLQVRWTQESNPGGEDERDDTAEEAPVPTTDDLVPLVTDWLAESEATIESFEITSLEIGEDGTVLVALQSPTAPPESDVLAALIESRLGLSLPVTVEWSGSSSEDAASGEALTTQIMAIARQWAQSQPGDLNIDSVVVSQSIARIELIGQTPPRDAVVLADTIAATIDQPLELQVRFTARQIIPTATTASTTTTELSTTSTSTASTSTTDEG